MFSGLMDSQQQLRPTVIYLVMNTMNLQLILTSAMHLKLRSKRFSNMTVSGSTNSGIVTDSYSIALTQSAVY